MQVLVLFTRGRISDLGLDHTRLPGQNLRENEAAGLRLRAAVGGAVVVW
jgi:hypothetical protein